MLMRRTACDAVTQVETQPSRTAVPFAFTHLHADNYILTICDVLQLDDVYRARTGLLAACTVLFDTCLNREQNAVDPPLFLAFMAVFAPPAWTIGRFPAELQPGQQPKAIQC